MKKKCIIIAAGGTGGHIFPALSIAKKLINENWNIIWIGKKSNIEAILIPKNKIKIHFINISGIRGKNIFKILPRCIEMILSYYKITSIIKCNTPKLALCMGGYISAPLGIAAYLNKIPLIIHEQNRIAGLTNKWLSYIATQTLQAFPNTLRNAIVVGNPVREDLFEIPSPKIRFFNRQGPIRILVLGGSQGAKILNNIIPKISSILKDSIYIWHQVGRHNFKKVYNNYLISNAKNYKIDEFIDDIKTAYMWADLLICRSGALTIAEINTIGIAAIFVPYPHIDRQQYWNAIPLEKIGAAKILKEEKFKATKIVKILKNWNRKHLLNMAEKAKNNINLHSAKKIKDIIFNQIYKK